MKKIKYFIRFLWNYKKLIKISLSSGFRINDVFQLGDNIDYIMYWKFKNKYWIKQL